MNEERSRFAAAADLCALRDGGQPLPQRILILDTEEMSAALCDCTPDGVITQAASVEAQGTGEGFFPALSRHTGLPEADCMALCREQAAQTKRRYQRVLRGADEETPLLELPGGGVLSWADCRTVFAPVLDRLKRLLDSADGMLAQAGAERMDLRILPIGAPAVFYPVEAELRTHFGGDALMADRRFPGPRPGLGPDELVERGRELYAAQKVEKRSVFGHEVVLTLSAASSAGLSDFPVVLAAADTLQDDLLAGGEPSPPFFVGESESLHLVIDGEPQLFPLSPKLSGQIITIRLKTDDGGKCFLKIQNAADESSASLLPMKLTADRKE